MQTFTTKMQNDRDETLNDTEDTTPLHTLNGEGVENGCEDVTDSIPELAIQTAEAVAELYQITQTKPSNAAETAKQRKRVICVCLTLFFLLLSLVLTCYDVIYSSNLASKSGFPYTSHLYNNTIV